MALALGRRRNGIIDKLSPILKESVDQMLLAGLTYREIVQFLAEKDVKLSRQAVCNYARKFLATTQMLRIAQGNFQTLTEAIEKTPELDTAEGIIRVMSNQLLQTLSNMTPEDLASVDAAKLMREANSLIRVTAIKRRVDTQNYDDIEKSFEKYKEMLWETLHKNHPALYLQLVDALQVSINSRQQES